MVDAQIREELLTQLAKLPLGAQRQVLKFAHTLSTPRPVGVPGKSLLRFAGTISPEDCQIMSETIEAGCERVDPNEW